MENTILNTGPSNKLNAIMGNPTLNNTAGTFITKCPTIIVLYSFEFLNAF